MRQQYQNFESPIKKKMTTKKNVKIIYVVSYFNYRGKKV